jgi:hypothetical protein
VRSDESIGHGTGNLTHAIDRHAPAAHQAVERFPRHQLNR